VHVRVGLCGLKWLTPESAKVIKREVRKKHHSTCFGKCVPTDCTAFDWVSFGTKAQNDDMVAGVGGKPLETLSSPSTRPKFIRVCYCHSSSHSVYPYVVASWPHPFPPSSPSPYKVFCQINVYLRTVFG